MHFSLKPFFCQYRCTGDTKPSNRQTDRGASAGGDCVRKAREQEMLLSTKRANIRNRVGEGRQFRENRKKQVRTDRRAWLHLRVVGLLLCLHNKQWCKYTYLGGERQTDRERMNGCGWAWFIHNIAARLLAFQYLKTVHKQTLENVSYGPIPWNRLVNSTQHNLRLPTLHSFCLIYLRRFYITLQTQTYAGISNHPLFRPLST